MHTDNGPVSTGEVEAVIDTIRPALLLDGGNVRLCALEGNSIILEIQGVCRTCTSLPMTKRYGIEAEIFRQIPGIKEVHWRDTLESCV